MLEVENQETGTELETVTDEVTDTEGSPEGTQEEGIAGTTQQTEEETSNADKSRLGRKVKSLEESVTKLVGTISQLVEGKSQYTIPNRDEHEQVTDVGNNTDTTEMPEYITTPEDVEKYLRYREVQKSKEQQKYEKNYLGTISSLGGLDADITNDIIAEIQTHPEKFNVRHTGNPEADAKINYYQAKSSVLAKKIAPTRKPIGSGQTNTLPTGTSASTRSTASETSMPQLDEFASEFVKRTGMGEDSVKGALNGSKVSLKR